MRLVITTDFMLVLIMFILYLSYAAVIYVNQL